VAAVAAPYRLTRGDYFANTWDGGPWVGEHRANNGVPLGRPASVAALMGVPDPPSAFGRQSGAGARHHCRPGNHAAPVTVLRDTRVLAALTSSGAARLARPSPAVRKMADR
jgi:hypothetical protein